MVSWYLLSWWTGVFNHRIWSMVKVVTVWLQAGFWNSWFILSLCFRTSGIFECGLQYSRSEENIFVWAGVDLELRYLYGEQRATGHDNILDHHGLHWGASDSAMPQLAQRWQHWLTEEFGSIYSSGQGDWFSQMWWFVLVHLGVFWLFSKLLNNIVTLRARAENWCPLTLGCCSLNSSIHILTNDLRAQEWRRHEERKGEIDQWEAK